MLVNVDMAQNQVSGIYKQISSDTVLYWCISSTYLFIAILCIPLTYCFEVDSTDWKYQNDDERKEIN